MAPAFDVLPIGQLLGYQAMTVGAHGAESSLENALSSAGQFGLTPLAAKAEVRRVVAVVEAWYEHFLAAGVPPASVEALAQHIDRPCFADCRRPGLDYAQGENQSAAPTPGIVVTESPPTRCEREIFSSMGHEI